MDICFMYSSILHSNLWKIYLSHSAWNSFWVGKPKMAVSSSVLSRFSFISHKVSLALSRYFMEKGACLDHQISLMKYLEIKPTNSSSKRLSNLFFLYWKKFGKAELISKWEGKTWDMVQCHQGVGELGISRSSGNFRISGLFPIGSSTIVFQALVRVTDLFCYLSPPPDKIFLVAAPHIVWHIRRENVDSIGF